jgi:ParB family chromosome partitioning protein
MALKRREGGFATAAEKITEKNPTRTIKISTIVSPMKHDRSQFDVRTIENLAENIKEQGLLQPIVVRKLTNGNYERIAGFRRLEAVKLLKHTEILAHVIEADDLTALKAMLSENTAREDLNVYDKAVFFEEIILKTMQLSGYPMLMEINTHDLKKRLTRMRNRSRGAIAEEASGDELMFDTIMQKEILTQYGLGLDSFVKFMAVLDFHKLIIEAIKNGEIERASAAEVNRLSTHLEEIIPVVLQRVSEEKMGVREVSTMVSTYLKSKKLHENTDDDLKKDIKKIINIKKIPKEKREEADVIISNFLEQIKHFYI